MFVCIGAVGAFAEFGVVQADIKASVAIKSIVKKRDSRFGLNIFMAYFYAEGKFLLCRNGGCSGLKEQSTSSSRSS
jgi:hypothetical protein